MIVRNVLITDAPVEPLKDQEAVDHLRDDIQNFSRIRPYLVGARQSIEQELIGLRLCQQVYELQMDDWITDTFGSPVILTTYPNNFGWITLPCGPVVAVNSIKYYDSANADQTLSTSMYWLDNASVPGRIRFTGSAVLPGVYDRPNAVRINYTAGYGAAAAVDSGQSAVPEALKNAIRFRMQILAERGEGAKDLEPVIQNLIAPYRLPI